MQVRSLARGAETVLGDAAADDELFLTSQLLTRWAALPACHMVSSLWASCCWAPAYAAALVLARSGLLCL